MFIEHYEHPKKENQIKNIMENNIISLRKIQKNEKVINKIKDSNILSFSLLEKNNLISLSSFKLSEKFKEYWNNEKNKYLLLLRYVNNEQEIISQYSIDKIELIKFILFQYNQLLNNDFNNYNDDNKNIIFLKNIFDDNIINKLIISLNEYNKLFDEKIKSTQYSINNEKNINNSIIKFTQEEIIIFNICKILIKLSVFSRDFSFLLSQNDKNLEIILTSLYYFQKKNQFISTNILILIYNLYLDDKNRILNKCNKLIPFIYENLNNYQNNPIENIIHIDFLFNLLEFLSLIINEKEFYLNQLNVNKFILLMINIYTNYANDSIKICSLKCLSNLFHCVKENTDIKINNLVIFIKSLLKNLNIELNSPFIFIKTLEIISSISYLFEIEEFYCEELLNEINQILISLILHKENIKIYYDKIQINCILDNISILLLNFCLSSKVCEYITQNTTIIKNVILILYNYSIELDTVKNLYDFINEFMDNIDNFMFLVLCNFLEIGILKNLDKYSNNKNDEIVLMILNLAIKALEFGKADEIEKNENHIEINFVQSFLDKKGFNDILNSIISLDYGNMECFILAKKIQEDFFL